MTDDLVNASSNTNEEKQTRLIQDDIEIPEFYWQNRITIMNINSQKQFFYWELTSDFLQDKLSRVEDEFIVRVIVDSVEADSFGVNGRNGSYYTKYKKSFASLKLKLLSLDNVVLLESNELILPSYETHKPQKEIWMTKKRGEIITKKYSGTLEQAQNYHGSSFIQSFSPMHPWANVSVNQKDAISQSLGAIGLSSGVLSSHSLSSHSLSSFNIGGKQ